MYSHKNDLKLVRVSKEKKEHQCKAHILSGLYFSFSFLPFSIQVFRLFLTNNIVGNAKAFLYKSRESSRIMALREGKKNKTAVMHEI